MGCGSSKDEGEQEVPIAFNPKDIYFDRTGNLRYGHVVNDKEDELRRVVVSDLSKVEDGGVSYIIDSSWMFGWLYFTHYDRNVSPNPGPCNNEELVRYDSKKRKWVAKEDLVMQLKDKPGNYCRVRKEVWDVFIECYPGSGPEIMAVFNESKTSAHDGIYDTSRWVVDQEFFAEKEVEPVELDVSEDAVVDTSTAFAPDALQMPIPANDPSAFEKRRLRLKQQFLAAINMTDETITNDKRNEVFNFFGYSTIERPPDAKDDSIPKKYTSEKKNSVVSTKTPKAKAKQTPESWLFGQQPQVQ